MNRDKLYKLKQSELNVLNVLWEENEPLMASEIARKGELINSTVQVAVRELMKSEIISVMDIVVNITALSRKYVPNLTKSEYENILLVKEFKKIVSRSISNPSFVLTLVEQSDMNTANSEIDALQKLVDEYKEVLKKKDGYRTAI